MLAPMSTASTGAEAVHELDSGDATTRLVHGGALRMVVYVLSILMSIGSVPFVTHHLGKVNYGYFATAGAIVFIISGFTEAGLNAFGVREYATGRADKDAMLRNLVGLRVSLTGFCVLAVAGVAALTSAPEDIKLGILVAGGGLMVTIAAENFGIPLNAEMRLNVASMLSLIQQFVLCAGYVVLVVLGAGVLPLLAMTTVSGAALFTATAFAMRGRVSTIPLFNRRVWRDILVQTLPYAAASAVGIIYFREALILTQALSSAGQAGYYAAAFRIVDVLGIMPYQLVLAGFPILARAAHHGNDDRLRYALQRLVDLGWLVGVWAVLCVFFGASFGIAVIAPGHEFRGAVPVLQIQGISVLATFMVAVYGTVMLSVRHSRDLVLANALAVVVATVLSVALIPHFGAKGAAVAAVASETSLAIVYAVLLHRRRRDLRVSLSILPRVAVAAAVPAAITALTPLPSVGRLVLFSVLYLGASLSLRTIPPEVINAARRRVRR